MVEEPAKGSLEQSEAGVRRSRREVEEPCRLGASLAGGTALALRAVSWLLLAVATAWLGYQFWRLTLQTGPLGAIDLRMRWQEVNQWFDGRPVYGLLHNAVYPPASYALLWPVLGWSSTTTVRWIWAVISLIALFRLCSDLIRHGGGGEGAWRRLPALVALASYPVGASIGNGQLGLIVLPCLLASLPLIARRDRSWLGDGCLAALFLVALVKPTLAGFFFWMLLFTAGSLRPAVLVCAGYTGLTCVASLFQRQGPVALTRGWLDQAVKGSAWGADLGEGRMTPESARAWSRPVAPARHVLAKGAIGRCHSRHGPASGAARNSRDTPCMPTP